MKEKKNVFKKLRDWWKEELDQDTRDWLKVVALWTVDGAMFGTLFTAIHKDKKAAKIAEAAWREGVCDGMVYACKQIVTGQQQQQPIITRMPANYIHSPNGITKKN